MQPETRYAKSGDAHIAYQVMGDGPFDLVLVPGWVSHLDLNWAHPTFPRFANRLASFSRLILFDKRGTGLSDPMPGPASLDQRVEDIRAVMDAADSEYAALLGFSEGGPHSVVFAATYPERTKALVLCGSFVRMADMPPASRDRFEEMLDHWGEGYSLPIFAPSVSTNALYRKGIGVYERAAASPAMARATYESHRDLDISPLLAAVQVPALVVHRRDEIIPIEQARELARLIPGARAVELPGIDHIPWIGDSNAVLDAIEEFLTGSHAARDTERELATLMFTDIVGGTTRAAELGDAAWHELLDAHNATIRGLLGEHYGREINTTGDGFLAAFDRPTHAARCARVIVDAVRPLGIEIRVGLHTGECERMDGGDLGGIAVHIAARVADLAGPGEVLVSSTLRDLVIGSGVDFADRGLRDLRGVPGEWRIYAVTGEHGESSPAVAPTDLMTRTDRVLLRAGQRMPRAIRGLARITGRSGFTERRRSRVETETRTE